MNLKGKLQWLVLDEADRLLDMGLGDQVKQIVQLIRANEASKSQPWWRSVLVSATVTPSVQALAKERMLCGDQTWIWVKGAGEPGGTKATVDRASMSTNGELAPDEENSTSKQTEVGYSESTPRQLAQFHITVTAKLRLSTLVSFLVHRVSLGQRTVVFMGTCACVDFHHRLFQAMDPLWPDDKEDAEKSKNGIFGTKAQIFKLHGSVQHSKRNQTLKLFEQAKKGAILLTTDVSARGLNLEDVDWTVQYDPPCEIADYVHRVGRVARAGKAGHSLLFLLPSEKGYLDVLQTKGISNLEPLALSATLNKAASLCSDWTNAGLKFGGNKEVSSRSKGNDSLRGSQLGEYFAGEVQRRLEDCIVQENTAALSKWKDDKKANRKRRKDTPNKPKEGELMELARDAFMSFLRSYSTKREAAVRSIFSARALHVGHVARSFALKDPPKSLVSKHKQSQKAISDMEAMDKQANRPKALQFNQYDNNLVSLPDHEDDDSETMPTRAFEIIDRPTKRPKLHTTDASKAKNAKALLLQNAMKMQSNLMDAM
jgi:ATP-dependent RNA helicase DDX31/DBP7